MLFGLPSWGGSRIQFCANSRVPTRSFSALAATGL